MDEEAKELVWEFNHLSQPSTLNFVADDAGA